MKPAYLVEIVADESSEVPEYFAIPADHKWRIIGRRGEKEGVKADFQIQSNDTSISRLQGEINCEIDGQNIHYKHLAENSKTFIGTVENPYQTEVPVGTSEQLSFGHVLTMGNNKYQLQLKQFKEVKPLIEAKLNETMHEGDLKG